MKQDRFLLVILAAIGLLTIVAIALFFIRQNSQTFSSDETPEGVLRNYILAVNQGDYGIAYDYLLETENKPDFEEFQHHLSRKSGIIEQTALKIISVDLTEDEAKVKVIVSREGMDLFDTRYSIQHTVVLTLQEGGWKLPRMPYPFGY
jgi:hypothetical protein